MAEPIRPVRLNHLNLVLQDFDASVGRFQELFGAEFMVDMPNTGFRACLIQFAGVIFEFFVPEQWLFTARYGPHCVGLEYQADMDKVRAAVASHGVRIVRDIGLALHTHPHDCHGVAYEFYDGSFHERPWDLLGGLIKPAKYWRDEHPLALTGLKAWTLAVEDLGQARGFIENFLGARVVYEAERPAVAGRAVGLQVSDDVIEVIVPTGPGAIRDFLDRRGQGIRSAVFGTRSIAAVQRWFDERNVALEPGTADGAFAVPAEANLGMIFEFME